MVGLAPGEMKYLCLYDNRVASTPSPLPCPLVTSSVIINNNYVEIQDYLQMPVIQTSAVIGNNEDGSDITQDVDVLVWWRDVGQARFPHISVMTRQFLSIPVASATPERVFSFAGLTLSDLRKSLLEGLKVR